MKFTIAFPADGRLLDVLPQVAEALRTALVPLGYEVREAGYDFYATQDQQSGISVSLRKWPKTDGVAVEIGPWSKSPDSDRVFTWLLMPVVLLCVGAALVGGYLLVDFAFSDADVRLPLVAGALIFLVGFLIALVAAAAIAFPLLMLLGWLTIKRCPVDVPKTNLEEAAAAVRRTLERNSPAA